MTEQLVPSISIDNLLAQRDAIVERLRTAAELFGEMAQLAESALGTYGKYSMPALSCRRAHVEFPDGVETLVRHVDAAFWDKLMGESGLRTFMDATARERWRKDINEAKVPRLTQETIEETFRGLFADRKAMFERGVIACFQKLSWDYKTNLPVKFGKRIIMEYVVDVWGKGRARYVTGPTQSGCDRLDDLIRVLMVLDGKSEPDHRQGAYQTLHTQINIRQPLPKEPFELNGMLSIRVYRNGNAHVTFLRPDLVDKLNAIVAAHYPNALPPASECKNIVDIDHGSGHRYSER